MIEFAAAYWNPANEEANRRARQLEAAIRANEIQVCAPVREPGWLILTWHEDVSRNIVLFADGRGAVLGKTFARDGGDASSVVMRSAIASASDFRGICEMLSDQCWGTYAMLWADDASGTVSAFRDPLGGLDCVSWESGGLRIITSYAPACVRSQRSMSIGIDWHRVLSALSKPGMIADKLLLSGVCPIPPGGAITFGPDNCVRRQVWNAADHANRVATNATPAPHLRSVVSECIAAWRAEYPEPACEISGGLDSAIVAILSAKSGALLSGYNYYTSDVVGDERLFARAVARQGNIRLIETLMPVKGLSYENLDGLPVGNRPAIGAVSLFHDRDLANRAVRAGATSLFTGQGGDAVFFQHAAIEMAADCQGSWRDQARQLAALSQWTGKSFWRVLARRAGMGKRRGSTELVTPPRFFSRESPIEIASSAWAGDIRHLSPAKRLHVEALTQARLAWGASWTSSVMTAVHPLLSQPIVEMSLAYPVITLTEGFRDRGFARQAFATDLPSSVIQRHGKGSLTAFFGQNLARSLPFLRQFLLDGALAAHGVLARDLLETALDENYLMQHDIYPELIWLILTEHWARGWCGLLDDAGRSTDRFDNTA